MAVAVLEAVGRTVTAVFEETGRSVTIFWKALRWGVRPPYDVREWFRQMVRVGVDSIPIVLLSAMFTGMVLALETFEGFARFHAEGFVGSVVALSMLRELGPVLTGIIVAGRVGSSMAAELGTMRVTEQIDALSTLATDPIQYLVVPRVLASAVMLPLLTVMANALGIYGGYVLSVQMMGANPVQYADATFNFLDLWDFWNGPIKAVVFGVILSVVGCQKGFYTTGGAEGVGRATTQAVVMASLVILISDFFLAKLLP